jgi:hypothetical protein
MTDDFEFTIADCDCTVSSESTIRNKNSAAIFSVYPSVFMI